MLSVSHLAAPDLPAHKGITGEYRVEIELALVRLRCDRRVEADCDLLSRSEFIAIPVCIPTLDASCALPDIPHQHYVAEIIIRKLEFGNSNPHARPFQFKHSLSNTAKFPSVSERGQRLMRLLSTKPTVYTATHCRLRRSP